jgi:hypothetical protein
MRSKESRIQQRRWFTSKYNRVILSLALSALLSSQVSAQQANQTKAGVLTCRTSASLGLIVGSHQKMRCLFTPDGGGPAETYFGHINRLGLDLGVRAGGAMVWAVLAPTTGMHYGALAGTYVGGSGSVSVGLGANANVLVGCCACSGRLPQGALAPVAQADTAGTSLVPMLVATTRKRSTDAGDMLSR